MSILIRVEPFSEPRLPPAESTVYALEGTLGGGLLAWPLAFLDGERAVPPRGLPIGLGLGIAFRIVLPLLTGLLLPTASVDADLLLSRISGSQLALHLADVAALSIRYTIIAISSSLLVGLSWGLAGGH